MPIRFACTECGAQFQAPDHLAGKPVACPKCKKKTTVPPLGANPAPGAPANGAPGANGSTAPKTTSSGPGSLSGPASRKPSAPSGSSKDSGPGAFSAQHGAEKLPPPVSDSTKDLSGKDQDEAIEAFMSMEREKEKALLATTIDFNCSNCDEPLKLPLDMGGKQTPCPSCSRIIRVPMPKRTDGAAWKAVQGQGPAAARRDLDPVPEGMQGQARAEVSRETLEEADAVIARPRPKMHIKTRIRQAVLTGMVAALVVLAVGVFVWFRAGQQVAINLQKTVAAAEADLQADKDYPGQAKALFQLVAAQTLLPVAEDVSAYFKKYTDLSLADLRKYRTEAGGDPDKLAPIDVLHGQLIQLLLAMGGPAEEARQGKKAKWDDVQERLRASFTEMTYPEIRLSVWRTMVRALIAAKEPNRALALFNTCFPKAQPNRKNRQGEEVVERNEAAGIMGLEFLKAGDKANAGKSLDFLLKGAPPLKPSETGENTIALAMALNDSQRSLPGGVTEGDLETQVLGQVRGYALVGDLERAQKWAEKNPNLAFRGRVALATVKTDDANLQGRIARELADQANRPENYWAILSWCEDLGPGELTPEQLSGVFAKMPRGTVLDRELIGWCRYQIASRKNGALAGTAVEAGLPMGELLRLAGETEAPKPAPDDATSKVIAPFLKLGTTKSPVKSK